MNSQQLLHRIGGLWPMVHTVCVSVVFSALIAVGCSDKRVPANQYLAEREEAAATQPAPNLEPWSPGLYRIGVGDTLNIAITGLEALNAPVPQNVRVSLSGDVVLPMVERVPVAGLNLDEIESRIRAAYVPKYMKDTDVIAQVVAYEAVSAMVIGDVTRAMNGSSLVEMHRNKASVLYALLTAGGAADYGGTITLVPARAPSQMVTYNLSNRADLVRAARIGSVEQGDLLIVDMRPQDSIFIQGLVTRPGPVPMPRTAQMTVMQAIGAAGGPLLAFEPREATIYRHHENGALVGIKVDLDAVKAGTEPDMQLAAGDVLILPHNANTRFEELLAKSLTVNLAAGVDTTYNPWTLYYLRKDASLNNKQDGGFFGSSTNLLQSGAITPLLRQP